MTASYSIYAGAEDDVDGACDLVFTALQKIAAAAERRQVDPDPERRAVPVQLALDLVQVQEQLHAIYLRIHREDSETVAYMLARMREHGGDPTAGEACPELFAWGIVA